MFQFVEIISVVREFTTASEMEVNKIADHLITFYFQNNLPRDYFLFLFSREMETGTQTEHLMTIPLEVLAVSCITYNMIDKIRDVLQQAERDLWSLLFG